MIKTAGDKMFAEGLAEGEAKGREEGIAEGKLESARKMVEAGADPAFVANSLDIDLEILSQYHS